MKKLCVKSLMIGNAAFLAGSEYECSPHPYREGYFLVTDSRGITVDLPLSTIKSYFIWLITCVEE
jgi:hypothetical protein